MSHRLAWASCARRLVQVAGGWCWPSDAAGMVDWYRLNGLPTQFEFLSQHRGRKSMKLPKRWLEMPVEASGRRGGDHCLFSDEASEVPQRCLCHSPLLVRELHACPYARGDADPLLHGRAVQDYEYMQTRIKYKCVICGYILKRMECLSFNALICESSAPGTRECFPKG